jgi:CubicO group peptidase (beta-lactamase class C family)
MIGFNTLLRAEGIDPTDVKLVRHQDTRHPERPTPYQLWQCDDGRFDLYQKLQKRAVFKGAKFLASFVATPLDETLFVGMYRNKGVGKARRGIADPSSGKDAGGWNLYDLVPSSRLKEYEGRLVIAWGEGYRSWVQLARKQDKAVVEVRRKAHEPLFPGFLDFSTRLSNLAGVPASWRTILSAVSGVYLFTHPETGKQYVGSAQGTGGFWGRWEQYVASGHGGNKRMRDIPVADYQISVLEVAASSASPDDVAKMESRWKEKLLTRKFGLNAN